MNPKLDIPVKKYLRTISSIDPLTKAEERIFIERIRAEDPSARAEMIYACLHRVVEIAGHYADKGIPMIELIAEGNLGLTEAGNNYDPERDGLFSVYSE